MLPNADPRNARDGTVPVICAFRDMRCGAVAVVHRGKEHGVLASLMGTIHPDEPAQRIRETGAVGRIGGGRRHGELEDLAPAQAVAQRLVQMLRQRLVQAREVRRARQKRVGALEGAHAVLPDVEAMRQRLRR